MALVQLYRSPVHDLGQDRRRFVAFFVTAQASIATDTPVYGAAYGGDATDAPLKAVVTNVRIEENWVPGFARFTVEYVGLRGK